jgi:hypothetical protein
MLRVDAVETVMSRRFLVAAAVAAVDGSKG